MDVAMHRSMHGWSHHARLAGLSMPQFRILMQLYYRGQCGISDISDGFEISTAAASQHVDNLVQAGLVERTQDPRDRRLRHIDLSPHGRRMLERGIRERYRWLDELARTLDDKDRERISEAITKLTEAARDLEST
jgi:DNA-binding MarR family transcriptional regulator